MDGCSLSGSDCTSYEKHPDPLNSKLGLNPVIPALKKKPPLRMLAAAMPKDTAGFRDPPAVQGSGFNPCSGLIKPLRFKESLRAKLGGQKLH